MEKFTQGEWVVSHHKDEVAVYMGEAVYSPYEYQCSDVWSCDSYWSEEDETAIANAHLISAAPDMYRALRGALDLLEKYEVAIDGEWGLGRDIETIESDGDLPKEILAARAALAKADGEYQ